MHTSPTTWYGTTIICVRRNNQVVLAGDGQVTLGNQIIKHSAEKLRTLNNDRVLLGFAGATADAMCLYEKLDEKIQKEEKISKEGSGLEKAVVELAKDWRTDKILRRYEAMMIVADIKDLFVLTGSGDVLRPEPVNSGEICSIGSGGTFALSAGCALLENTELSAEEIAERAMRIAANICTYTNDQISSLCLTYNDQGEILDLKRRTKHVNPTNA